MLHRALFGSLERFIGILLEHYGGHLPLWLSPTHAVVATITDQCADYARDVAARLGDAGLRVDADLRNEKIGYKVREHSAAKVPLILAVARGRPRPAPSRCAGSAPGSKKILRSARPLLGFAGRRPARSAVRPCRRARLMQRPSARAAAGGRDAPRRREPGDSETSGRGTADARRTTRQR